jgi:transglutaminase-like putative cysteine protease
MIAARLNLGLHLCVGLGALAFAVADAKPLLGALVVCATGAGWLLSRRARSERPFALPRLAINLLVLATIVNAAVRAAGGVETGESVVSTLGQFLVFLTLIKLLDRRGPRDDAQAITLSIFVAIAAILTSAELGVGVLLVGLVPTAVATVMLWQIRAGEVMVERSVGSLAAAGRGQVRARTVSGRNARRGFAGVCLATVLASCTMATVVFVLVPRIGGEFLGRFGVTRQVAIGYTETVRLGEGGRLTEDPTPVLDLMVTGFNNENIGSVRTPQYLRGGAKGWYNTQTATWEDAATTAPHRDTQMIEGNQSWLLPWPGGGRQPPPISGSSTRPVQRITMRGESNTIFCLWRPETIVPDRTVTLRFNSQTGTIGREQSWGPRFVYTVRSAVGDDRLPEPTMRLGFRDGPVRSLADGIVRGLRGQPTTRQIASAIKDYLERTCQYTTEMVAPPEGTDPIEFFLFDRQMGHCEYFASAMAAMCQSQGIPARVVTGYLATEFNSLTGQYLVRQSSAHAWTEVFIVTDEAERLGRWERFDPSPQAAIERIHRPAEGVLARLRGWYDALEFTWSSSVIGFDNVSGPRREGREPNLSRAVYSGADRAATLLRKFSAWLKAMRADPALIPWWVRVIPGVAIALAAAAVVAWRWLKGVRATRWSARPEMGYLPERPSGFYARALRTLERAGEEKPETVPPDRFAEELRRRSPGAAGALRRIVELYYRTRFGGVALTAAEVAEGERCVHELANGLREARASRAG